MDTDDLTDMAYDSIRFAAGFCDELKAELGAMSGRFEREDEYLRAMQKHVAAIKRRPREYLEGWNIVNSTDIGAFARAVDFLAAHIEETIRAPLDRRKQAEKDRHVMERCDEKTRCG